MVGKFGGFPISDIRWLRTHRRPMEGQATPRPPLDAGFGGCVGFAEGLTQPKAGSHLHEPAVSKIKSASSNGRERLYYLSRRPVKRAAHSGVYAADYERRPHPSPFCHVMRWQQSQFSQQLPLRQLLPPYLVLWFVQSNRLAEKSRFVRATGSPSSSMENQPRPPPSISTCSKAANARIIKLVYS